MARTALRLLWLLLAFALAAQELVELDVSPGVSAECGKRVTLRCHASSQEGLAVTYMGWFHRDMSLCSVDGEEVMTTREDHSLSAFSCEYEDGRLSLVFQEVLPPESESSKSYTCKLRSNRGMTSKRTKVELKECSGTADGAIMSDGPSCTFSQVYPDGDVRWSRSDNCQPNGSLSSNTTKSVDHHGWLTVRSWLTDPGDGNPDGPYCCCLKSTSSDECIATTLVKSAGRLAGPGSGASGVGSRGIRRTVLSLSVSLIITLKYWI